MIAWRNGNPNGLYGAVGFEIADSYAPATSSGRCRLDELRSKTTFVLANPPPTMARTASAFAAECCPVPLSTW